MIDKLRADSERRKGMDNENGYTPDQVILNSVLHRSPRSNQLTVVSPPWHSSQWLNNQYLKRFNSLGSDVLLYDIDHRALGTNPLYVKESYELAAEKMAEDIGNMHHDEAYEKIALVGVSIGNLAVSLVVNKIPHAIDSVKMVVPGAELAEPFWNGYRTHDLSETYREKGYTLAQIQEGLWSNLAPRNYVAALEGKQVRVILAKKDIYIPYESGRELVNVMRQKNINPSVFVSKRGHVTTIVADALGLIK